MNMNDLELGETFEATVRDSAPLTDPGAAEEVRELLLDLSDRPLRFEIGQCVAVFAPPRRDFGEDRHIRLYSIASAPETKSGEREIALCVRRCRYLDPFSGEASDGIASNYLCDAVPGDRITLAGPIGHPFALPADERGALLMIGMGTGIAPFRGLVKHIYRTLGGWQGPVRLFHGGRSGLEMIYRNEARDDFAQYMDAATFQAIEALSPRPAWSEPVDFQAALSAHREEVWRLLREPDTHVYLAGVAALAAALDSALAEVAGSSGAWQRRKAELLAGGRWTELLYG